MKLNYQSLIKLNRKAREAFVNESLSVSEKCDTLEKIFWQVRSLNLDYRSSLETFRNVSNKRDDLLNTIEEKIDELILG